MMYVHYNDNAILKFFTQNKVHMLWLLISFPQFF